MADQDRFFHESMQDTFSIKAFLQALQDGLDNGRIVLSAHDEQMVLTPAALLHFSIKAKKKGGSSKVQIKIMWEDQEERQSGTDNELFISSE